MPALALIDVVRSTYRFQVDGRSRPCCTIPLGNDLKLGVAGISTGSSWPCVLVPTQRMVCSVYNAGVLPSTWATYSFQFIATATTHTLQFGNTLPYAGDQTTFFDNVVICAVACATNAYFSASCVCSGAYAVRAFAFSNQATIVQHATPRVRLARVPGQLLALLATVERL